MQLFEEISLVHRMYRRNVGKNAEANTLNYLNKTRAILFSSIKDINHSKVANLIYAARSISRAEISRHLSISKTTVTSVTRELLADGIIRETGKGETQKGRRPLLLEFNERYKLAIGIDIGAEQCVSVVTDLYAQPIQKPVFTRYDESFESTVKSTLDRIETNFTEDDILGVSIGIPGIYDAGNRSIRIAESLGISNFPIQELQERIPFPIQVINRANAAALGERWSGLGRNVTTLIYVYLGEGIGSGIILNNELYEGSTGCAGELGHTIVLPHGPLCRCGSFGCLETLISENNLLAKTREIARYRPKGILAKCLAEERGDLSLDLIRNAVHAGDEECRKLIDQQAEYIGLALSNFANLIDPELIIIGGDIATALGELLIPRIREVVGRNSPYLTNLKISLSQLGPLAVAVGACAYLLR